MTTEIAVIEPGQARLNITLSGLNGDLPDMILYDLSDREILQITQEAIRGGGVPGIPADPSADFTDFVVDRFAATHDVPWGRVCVRPKTPFG